ncbi:MAG: hypothetical protein ACRENL_00800 [Candidatus Dormibacteria bacterium]
MTVVAQPDLWEAASLRQARRQRDSGIALVEGAESSVWMTAARRCIDRFARSGEEFSSEDVRAAVGAPLHPAAMGALFMAAVRDDGLLRVGRVQSCRPEARGRWLATYRGAIPPSIDARVPVPAHVPALNSIQRDGG